MRSKITAALILTVLIILSFAGCGSFTLSMKGEDGVKVTAEFEKKPSLQRCPHFTESGDGILMHFNGKSWYFARIIGKDEAAEIGSLELMAESSNIKVYLNADPDEYDPMREVGEGDTFFYLMTLEGTDDSFVLFTTDGTPAHGSYWNDFETCVTYKAGKQVTVPDTDFTLTDACREWEGTPPDEE